MGPMTEDAPMASPPTMRKQMREPQLQAAAQPMADARYSAPSALRQARRPYRSLGALALHEPTTVPHKALETVMPSRAGESEKVSVSDLVVPEITAVSNPNNSPPRAAT